MGLVIGMGGGAGGVGVSRFGRLGKGLNLWGIVFFMHEVLTVPSRQVLWLFPELLRLQPVPVLHHLQRRLAAEG